VIADTELIVARPVSRIRVRLGTRAVLGCIVVVSTLVRLAASIGHVTASFFPDEYLYSAVSRSLGADGRPLVRGEPAHFPALLEPLAAAPLWALASIETAYRLVQAENAVFMSLAAIPAYLIARRVGLGSRYALACAAFAVAIPDLAFAPSILTDPMAYPLVLGALYAGLVALETGGWRAQLAFVGLAAAVTLTRVEYAVLVPVFVAGALVLDRRAAFHRQRLPFALFAAAALGALAFGPHRVLGYYSYVVDLHLGTGLLKWAGLDLFFLALAGGVVLVPGAVVALLLPGRTRVERAFSALAVPFALALMVETALISSDGTQRFRERYLFAILPLLPIAFGLYLKRGRPGRSAVLAIAAAIAIAAALMPLSHAASGHGSDDSPLLWSYNELQWHLGAVGASSLFAACAIAAAGLAALLASKRMPRPAVVGLGAALVAVSALSLGASLFDTTYAQAIRAHLTAPNPSWVDAAHVGPVDAIETDAAPPASLMQQLFWNTSIEHELLLGSNALATDSFGTQTMQVGTDGTLSSDGRPLDAAFLFQQFEVTPVLVGAVPVARYSSFTLYRPSAVPALRALEAGRFWDGWLAPSGGLEVWPAGTRGGTLSFTLSLPGTRPGPVEVRFGSRIYRLVPGSSVRVRLRVPGGKPWSIAFGTAGAALLPDGRPVSVRSSVPVFAAG
jgi:Dolichyl-phosphate-mannose-protein mannosyltransferase